MQVVSCLPQFQGMALLYLHLSETVFKDNNAQRKHYIEKAVLLLDHIQHSLRGKRVTFLCGDAGEKTLFHYVILVTPNLM